MRRDDPIFEYLLPASFKTTMYYPIRCERDPDSPPICGDESPKESGEQDNARVFRVARCCLLGTVGWKLGGD